MAKFRNNIVKGVARCEAYNNKYSEFELDQEYDFIIYERLNLNHGRFVEIEVEDQKIKMSEKEFRKMFSVINIQPYEK